MAKVGPARKSQNIHRGFSCVILSFSEKFLLKIATGVWQCWGRVFSADSSIWSTNNSLVTCVFYENLPTERLTHLSFFYMWEEKKLQNYFIAKRTFNKVKRRKYPRGSRAFCFFFVFNVLWQSWRTKKIGLDFRALQNAKFLKVKKS